MMGEECLGAGFAFSPLAFPEIRPTTGRQGLSGIWLSADGTGPRLYALSVRSAGDAHGWAKAVAVASLPARREDVC
jgi:hypothetical protein